VSRRLTRLNHSRLNHALLNGPLLNHTVLDGAALDHQLLKRARRDRTTLDGTALNRPPARAAACLVCSLLIVVSLAADAQAKKGRAPAGGRAAVVVDERLSALRDAPALSANLLQRLGRGRVVALRGQRVARDGVTFYRVDVTRRTGGWVQSDALVAPSREGDDRRLLRLIDGSDDFDRVERAAIFLETFPRSALRPAVLLLLAESAEAAAQRLSQEARRRLDAREMTAGGAPLHSYFLNFNSLDRYRRHGVAFTFDAATRQFRYDGAAWREILRRHPASSEATRARESLGAQPAR
jgi:hypothetical protein